MRRFGPGILGFGALLVGAMPQRLSAADCGPALLQEAILERVTPEGDLLLSDQRRLRLAGLHLPFVPQPQINTPPWPRTGDRLIIGLLDSEKDRWSRLPAIVFTAAADAPPEWLQQRLLRRGAALARPEPLLEGCWPLLKQAEAEAGPALQKTPAEPGRFARISGRVSRVGDGRSAHFITVFDTAGQRATGLVQKRHLKRFKDAGVDVTQLRGQFIRIRGVRSATNASIIPLTSADQIEIVR
jgi:hypothetical protein